MRGRLPILHLSFSPVGARNPGAVVTLERLTVEMVSLTDNETIASETIASPTVLP